MSAPLWIPAGETLDRALLKWHAARRISHRNTGNQDLPIGQFVLYSLRFVLADDLADARTDYGGLAAQLNHIAVVLDLSTTGRQGIAVTYDYRMRRAIQKIARTLSEKTDYIELRSNLNKAVRATAIRDFEAKAGAIRKDREAEKAADDKEKGETKKKSDGGNDNQ